MQQTGRFKHRPYLGSLTIIIHKVTETIVEGNVVTPGHAAQGVAAFAV